VTRFRTAGLALPAGLMVVLVAACGQAAESTHDVSTSCASPVSSASVAFPASAPSASAASPASSPSAVIPVVAALRDGRADPAPRRVPVPRGARVQLTVTSDRAVEVHLHGYDLAYQAGPGQSGCIAFTADLTGLFDIEAHPDTRLVQLEVR
jgi:hypothetical protein